MSPEQAPERLVTLFRERDERDATGCFAIAGVRFLVAASDAGAAFELLAVAPETLRSVAGRMIVRRLRRRGVPVARLSPDALERACAPRDPQGVAAIVRRQNASVAAIAGERDGLWVSVEHVRAPGNLGTIMRTAAAVGASGVVVLADKGDADSIDPWDPDVTRASMGGLFALRIVSTTLAELRAVATRARVTLVGATPEARLDFRRARWRRPLVLLLGAERTGLSVAQRDACDELVRIPMAPRVDSLNLGVAASVLLYEAWSRRHPPSSRVIW